MLTSVRKTLRLVNMNVARAMTAKEAKAIGRPWIMEVKQVDSKYRGSGLYVLEFADGVKVGIGKNLCNRLKFYEMPFIKPVSKGYYFKCLNPARFETILKRHFSRFTKLGSSEYFHGVRAGVVLSYLKSISGAEIKYD